MFNQQTMQLYTLPRKPEDFDLVFLLGLHLEKTSTPVIHKNFIEDPFIKSIATLNTGAQRVLLNKWFMEKLLIHRSTHELNVTENLMLLVNDGATEDWFKIIRLVVLPFMITHGIL